MAVVTTDDDFPGYRDDDDFLDDMDAAIADYYAFTGIYD